MKYAGNYYGDLFVYSEDDLTELLSVSGHLGVYEGTTISAPLLTECGGDLTAYEGATISAPLLTECGDLTAYEGATISAPLLTECGDLTAYEGATISVPLLRTINGLPIADAETAERNLRVIAPLALAEGALKMGEVHACETTHCMAGWSCAALPGGKKLEKTYGWSAAGFHLLGLEAGMLFHSGNNKAIEFLKRYV
ncbi:MAG: hypothetical protein ACRC1W_14985 [Shewanella sp.]